MNQTQLAFLPGSPPAQAHSKPSVQAATRIIPAAGTLRRMVLDYLRGIGSAGATDEEIQHDLDLNPSTERPRRIELVRLGLVCSAAAVRKTDSGRWATVWRAI